MRYGNAKAGFGAATSVVLTSGSLGDDVGLAISFGERIVTLDGCRSVDAGGGSMDEAV